MDNKYWIIIKTGEAEIRALENIPKAILFNTLPLIEITRGRKVTKNKIETYPFEKRLSKLKDIYKGQTIAIDVTSEESLSSPEVDYLYTPDSGYKNWVNFLIQLKNESVFEKIIPTVLFNFEDDNFEENITKQIQELESNFKTILYRSDISDENCYDDIELINNITNKNLKIVIDCGYVPQASYQNVANKCIARIDNLKSIITSPCEYIVASTSFPNNVRDLGDLESDTFSISEIDIYNIILQTHKDIVYADYASINPVRNDTITMARGWIPRIDVPLDKTIFYYKKRRPKGVSAYASTYIQVAQSVCADLRFPHNLNIWGINQIHFCAEGGTPSASPSFWISVRMNIHITQQVNRIYSI
ncbi:beta family protein [Porphyromonas gingivalis]|uniref:beta family protein n=1 Tax=Porphyromonas gingivalis TaxID=837 RepID=UPI000974F72F|nr:beta family protein [Porphyromonas gingivalis]SJL20917.1 hypothetical protein PGIN_3A1_00335 [Porphyromonas gingivalis]